MAQDPHTGFILAAYAATAVIVGGLILRAVLDQRAQSHALAELARRGMSRRSRGTAPAIRDHGRGVTEGASTESASTGRASTGGASTGGASTGGA